MTGPGDRRSRRFRSDLAGAAVDVDLGARHGASPSDLTDALGINRTSMYAAFGDKEELFRRALARSAEAEMACAHQAFTRPTVYEVVETFPRANADALTRADRPPGVPVRAGRPRRGRRQRPRRRVPRRQAPRRERALADRLTRAVETGDLPAGIDPVALARCVMVVSQGSAVHAAAGAHRAALHASVDIALRAVPAPEAGGTA